MNVRGIVAGEVSTRTVRTEYGERELAEVPIRRDGEAPTDETDAAGESTRVTCWGKWTESTDLLEPGMELLVTDAERTEFRGEEGFSTTGDSYVVVEPSFLVNVTDIRSWTECPRLYYLNKLSGIPLNYPVTRGTLVHEVFGDLLRGRDVEESIEARVEERGLELGMLGESAESVTADVRKNAAAIEGWLEQGRLGKTDGGQEAAGARSERFAPDESEWRSERLLISETFGIRGRADAIRDGAPVELKTGKNLRKEPRFKDKVQAACYALLLEENGDRVDTGTLLYTKNSALERDEETGDLTPAKEFSMGQGLLKYVVRLRNGIAAMEFGQGVPTGYEGDATCEYCFEQDTCMVVSGRLDQESKAGQIGQALPEAEREYFDRFYRAIEAERREVHREYAKLWEQSPEERADDDRALIDLEYREMRELDGGRWEIRARRKSAETSKIREGDLVLASDGRPVRGEAELARIERLESGSSGEVVLTADEPVEASRLDVYPSELTTDRQLAALHDALLKGSGRRKDVLFGREEPRFREVEAEFIPNNAAQDEAVRKAVGCGDFALIHGPPGAGKTYTIARAIRAMVERGDRVLLSAFTNRAVDNALEALCDQGFTDFVRMGTESGVRDDMRPYRLERSGDPEERARELREAPVVAATTATCGSRVMKETEFDVAVVDEAAQLTEPGTYAAANLADRFVLVGDHQQLPPVVRSEGGAEREADLSRSLFERLVSAYPEAGVMLERQYRMNQRIQAFASREFYEGALRPATPEVAGRTLDDLEGVSREELPRTLRDPVSFVDVEGDGSRHTDSEEAARIADLVESYEESGVSREEIGVIAPFRAQVGEIRSRVPEGVAVDTVDRFQGSSKEVIVVSFVATDELEGPIFEDYRRINVALTRPKRALVLVGDAHALGSDPVYGRMLEWARG